MGSHEIDSFKFAETAAVALENSKDILKYYAKIFEDGKFFYLMKIYVYKIVVLQNSCL